jgi:hypothetical protein
LVVLEPDEDVLLLREPGGEDVRVAMVINVIHSPTSHRDHSERVGRGPDFGRVTRNGSGDFGLLRIFLRLRWTTP